MIKQISDHFTKNMPLGYALHKFIKDDNNQPCDYVFIEANSAFEKYTGLSTDKIIGKKVTEVHPDIEGDSFNWIETYSKVAFEGQKLQFEQYFQPSKRWYKIYAYQPDYGYFITLVENITEQKNIESQNKVLETELEMHETLTKIYYDQYTNEQAFIDEVLHRALEMSKSQYGYIYLYDEITRKFQLNSWTNGVMADCKIIDKKTVYHIEKTGIWGEVVRQRKPIIINNFSAPNEKKKGYPKGHVEILNFLSIPVFENGEIVAVVGVANKDEGYTNLDENQLTLLMQNAWSIKKQKKLESELKKFKTITDDALYGKIIVDLSDHIVYVNKFFANIHGYTPNGLIGKPVSVFYSQEQLVKVDELIGIILKKGNFNMQEVWHTHKDGTEFPMLMNGILLKDEKDNPEYMAVSAIDITDLKEMETSLCESEERFRGIIQSMSDVVFTLDTKMRHTGVFGSWVEKSNLTKEFFLGKTAAEIFGPEHGSIHEGPIKKALSGENVIYDWTLNNGNKTTCYQTSLSPMYDFLGKVSGVVGIGRDITNIKELEQELNRFKIISDNALYGKAMADLKGNLTYVNKYFANIHGYKPEELMGKHISVFHSQEQLEAVELLNKGMRQNGYFDMQEVWHVHKDGKEFPMLMSGVLLKNEKESPEFLAVSAIDITEQKQIEEEKAQSASLISATIESTADGLLVINNEGIRTLINQRFIDMWHIPKDILKVNTDEAMLQYVIDQVENPEMFISKIQKLYKTPEAISFDQLCLTDGRVFERYSKPQRQGEKIVGRVWSFRDITEYKQAEAELRESEDRFRQISENIGEVFWLRNADNSKMLYLNPAYEKVWGRTVKSLYDNPQSFIDSVYNEDKPAVFAEYEKYIKTGEFDLEYRIVQPGGEVRWVRAQSFPVLNSVGEVIRHTGIAVDITSRKDMENQLFREKEQFETTLLSVGDGVISTDSQGKIVLLNPIAEKLTGWTQEEAEGKPVEEVFNIINEFTRERSENPVEKVLETGNIIELANHTLLISKDGLERAVEDSAAPIKDKEGNITGVVLVFRDFTEKKKVQDQIEFLSFNDVLTGLYNRRFFEEEMKRLDTTRNHPLTIIMADLNGLKITNDAFGHYEGDKLLKQTANLLKEYLRAEDIIARWGGDEFAVLMPQTTSEDAEKIVKRIIQKVKILNKEKNMSILSIAFGWDTKIDSTMDLENVFKIAEEDMYKKKISESQSVRGLTVKTIVNTLFEKSPREERHSQRVKKLATKIANEMKLPQRKVDDISTLGLLHDIGKIIVSGKVLEKKVRLTEAEYEEVKKHPAIGYRMLSAINEFSSIANGVLSHHERWDGKGYPNGLKGDKIPLEARIIAAADAYDAMTEERPYRKKINNKEAINELKKCSGTKFDPEVVDILVEKVLSKND